MDFFFIVALLFGAVYYGIDKLKTFAENEFDKYVKPLEKKHDACSGNAFALKKSFLNMKRALNR